MVFLGKYLNLARGDDDCWNNYINFTEEPVRLCEEWCNNSMDYCYADHKIIKNDTSYFYKCPQSSLS